MGEKPKAGICAALTKRMSVEAGNTSGLSDTPRFASESANTPNLPPQRRGGREGVVVCVVLVL